MVVASRDLTYGRVEATAPRLTLVNDVDILVEHSPLPLIGDLIGQGEVVLLYGAYGSNKTFLALDWSFHLASGLGQWQGLPTSRGSVVYIAGEGGAGLQKRVGAWKFYHHREPGEFLGVEFIRQVVPIHQEEYRRALLAKLVNYDPRPRMIVFDTVTSHLGGGDENASIGLGAFYTAARQLVESTGATVLLIHHPNDGGRSRGWKGLPNGVERIIKVEKKGRDRIVLVNEKARDSEPMPPFSLQLQVLEYGRKEDGQPYSSKVIVSDSGLKEKGEQQSAGGPATSEMPGHLKPTYDILRKHGKVGLRRADWCREAGIPEKTFDKHCSTLVELGWVKQPPKRGLYQALPVPLVLRS